MTENPVQPWSSAHRQERERRRAVAIRVVFFLAGLHVLAGFVMLLFFVGGHRH